MKYIAVYKCQLCDALVQYGEPQEISYELLPEICAKVIHNQLFAGNPYLYKVQMQIPHKCKNGDYGMAYFAGFMRVN
ncbi:hypothetical protein SDC9_176971 [bioreactor metagenome]|uniref:Uncharacterized protein n=1 Tax=bioreactor metagenome TaxID=1076179 RepID=A0A645GRN7_9ZZZZ